MEPPDAKRCRLVELCLRDAFAIVLDFESQYIFGVRKVDGDLVAICVLGNIGQGFLCGPVGDQLNGTGQRAIFRKCTYRCFYAGTFRETPCQPLDSSDQTLIQNGRAQIHHDALARVKCMLQQLCCRVDMFPGHGIGCVAADPGKIKPYSGQSAANVIMNFACNRGALLFYCHLQMFGKIRQSLL